MTDDETIIWPNSAPEDPPPEAVAEAMAQALCQLAHVDPLQSAAKPAGRLFSLALLLALSWALIGMAQGSRLHILAWSVMFLALATTLFRLWACCVPEPKDEAGHPIDQEGDEPLWTLLIALYREAGSIPSLLNALAKLDWPQEKLGVVCACEADDPVTLAALRLRQTQNRFRIILIPPGGPRTKPKALQTALPFCRGRYLTVYDAEDMPMPRQIREAWHRFRQGPANLAVVQAPLVIWNDGESWISRQFALDYAIWFRLILPALLRLSHLLPLGGTSNHFDIDYLRAVGGWDPYNVTEDADLGIRLARQGYTAALIPSPTFEEGAPTLKGWVRQRGRWIQGHIQTLSVHLRAPWHLTRQLGSRGLLAFCLGLSAGPMNAALLCLAGLLAIHQVMTGAAGHVMMWAGFMAISQPLIGGAAITRDGRLSLFVACITFPLYQVCHIPALCRAIWHLYLSPSFWDKTQHGEEARPQKSISMSPQPAWNEPQTWIGLQP